MEDVSTFEMDAEMEYVEEQDELDEGEGGGEEEIEDDEFMFRFEDDMNPLDFTENDASGVEPYQKFEKYEDLANRKREALSKLSNREEEEDTYVSEFDKLQKEMMPRKRRKSKKKGRRKGSRNKLSPEVTKKLGEANIYYAKRQYEDAKRVLHEAIMLAPNLAESYHTCGLVYEETRDKKKAMNFYMIAAHLAPKENPSLWKRLVAFSIEQGNTGQAIHCISKAIAADPEDMSLKFDRALLYIDKLGDYKKAAESYEHILGLHPENIEARKEAAKMHKKCGQIPQAINILEDCLKNHPSCADWDLVDQLTTILMEDNKHAKALQHIESALLIYCNVEQFSLHLTVKAGICHIYLGNVEEADNCFRDLQMKSAEDNAALIREVATSFMNLGHYESALKYFLSLDGIVGHDDGVLHLNIAQCYLSLKEHTQAIGYYYNCLRLMEDNIDARLTLVSLLLEEKREDDAIALLSPPNCVLSVTDAARPKPWWSNGKVKVKLAKIYHARGMLEDFVGVILSLVYETLDIESSNQKIRRTKKTSVRVLRERAELLNNYEADSLFYKFPVAMAPSVRLKASRAKKSLQEQEATREKEKAAVLAAGLDWRSDDSGEEIPLRTPEEPPLPNLFKDEEHYQLILNLCKALTSLQRYSEAKKVIKDCLKLASNTILRAEKRKELLPPEKRNELLSLEAQIALKTNDPVDAYDHARHIVKDNPHSVAAWNDYYKIVSRVENKMSRHPKFLHKMMSRYKDCVFPKIILGHQLTTICQHQSAAREYLEAYKLQPRSSLINLCVGTALISLALGFRLRNKHQCLIQGLAFLYNNLHLGKNSQQALYNIARACHHVGLITCAVSYYEKVLTMYEKDGSNDGSNHPETNKAENFHDLRREAAYNLHLIYKNSGASDLARQVLRHHCTL